MPLWKSSKKEAVGENIDRLKKEGKPLKQAQAIALDVQRKAAHGGRKEHLTKAYEKYLGDKK